MRVEDADADVFRQVFSRAVQDIAPLGELDRVRWYELMRLLLTWVYWRRPPEERPALESEAIARQPD